MRTVASQNNIAKHKQRIRELGREQNSHSTGAEPNAYRLTLSLSVTPSLTALLPGRHALSIVCADSRVAWSMK